MVVGSAKIVRATGGSRKAAISAALLATNTFQATEASWRAISSMAWTYALGAV